MKITFVTITNKTIDKVPSWEVYSQEITGKNNIPQKTWFLGDSKSSSSQKIKLGGTGKGYAMDEAFLKSTDEEILANITFGEVEAMDHGWVQTITVPFSRVHVNSKTLNPYVVDHLETDDFSQSLIVVQLDKEYSLIRSSCKDPFSEVICTFHTTDFVGAVLKVSDTEYHAMEKEDQIPILMVDTENTTTKKFEHFRIIYDTKSPIVIQSTIRNASMITSLKKIDQALSSFSKGRRFTRYSKYLITANLLIPNTYDNDKLMKCLENYDASSVLGIDPKFIVHLVPVKENGEIDVDSKEFATVVNTLVENRVKAVTLLNCKIPPKANCTGSLWQKARILYLFMCDTTHEVIKPLKCLKTN